MTGRMGEIRRCRAECRLGGNTRQDAPMDGAELEVQGRSGSAEGMQGDQRLRQDIWGCEEDAGWMGVQGDAGQGSNVGWDAGGDMGWVRGARGHLGVQWRMQRVIWAG